jgi:predicted ATPase
VRTHDRDRRQWQRKSSLYRALKLLADIAQGRIIQSLAAEAGLQSTLWAGPESFSRAMKAGAQPVQGTVRKNPISLKLGFAGADYGYAIDLGLPSSASSHFSSDPVIKSESLWTGERLGRSNAFALRNGPSVRIRNDAPGGSVAVATADAYFQVQMRQHGLLRPLLASELSDGTLRYLLLIAALLSPRPPALMILNEPETSLHPDLLPSLARLIMQASKQCQIIVVSHAAALVSRSTPRPTADRLCSKRPWAKRKSRITCHQTGRGRRDSASMRA